MPVLVGLERKHFKAQCALVLFLLSVRNDVVVHAAVLFGGVRAFGALVDAVPLVGLWVHVMVNVKERISLAVHVAHGFLCPFFRLFPDLFR